MSFKKISEYDHGFAIGRVEFSYNRYLFCPVFFGRSEEWSEVVWIFYLLWFQLRWRRSP